MTIARTSLVVVALARAAHAQPAHGVADPVPPDPSAPPPPYAPPPAYYPQYVPPPEPPPVSDRFAVALGGLVGGSDDWFYGAWTLEGGVTIPAPIRVRARLLAVLAGGTMESDWGGDFSRFGAGVEVRQCTRRGGGCLFGDLDVGYQHLTLYDHGGSFVRSDKGLFYGPRLGFDAGGAFRFRLAIELYRVTGTHKNSTDEDRESFGTFGWWMGVAYQR